MLLILMLWLSTDHRATRGSGEAYSLNRVLKDFLAPG